MVATGHAAGAILFSKGKAYILYICPTLLRARLGLLRARTRAPEGMSDYPEGRTRAPEGMSDPPEGRARAPEGMSEGTHQHCSPRARPEEMSDPPEEMSDPPKEMSDPPEGMSDPPEGMSDLPEGIPDPPSSWEIPSTPLLIK